MNEDSRILLLRYLDNRATHDEVRQVNELIRSDSQAREFLRELSEQSVMIADLERSALACEGQAFPGMHRRSQSRRTIPYVRWPWVALAASIVLIISFLSLFSSRDSDLIRVSKLTGSTEFFGARGQLEHNLAIGAKLRPGDTLQTKSCDAWIELELGDGSRMTLGGASAFRVLDGNVGHIRLKLLRGYLWVSPPLHSSSTKLEVETTCVSVASRNSQFDLQSSAAETTLRMNRGTAQVTRQEDGFVVAVAAGQQITVPLGKKGPFEAIVQPTPTDRWSCDLGRVPEVILGRWLPPSPQEQARLGAEPLLWPVPDREPVMLYAAALSVSRSSDQPILLRTNSVLIFRGRTEHPQTVRFGFSAQRMRGVFAGKFEVDVSADRLGPPGAIWTIELPLAHFRSLQPELAISPYGLELTDIYALTIMKDAGLELNHFELLVREAAN